MFGDPIAIRSALVGQRIVIHGRLARIESIGSKIIDLTDEQNGYFFSVFLTDHIEQLRELLDSGE